VIIREEKLLYVATLWYKNPTMPKETEYGPYKEPHYNQSLYELMERDKNFSQLSDKKQDEAVKLNYLAKLLIAVSSEEEDIF